MVEFDPQQVVDTIRLDAAPKSWRVFRGQPFTFQMIGCLFALAPIMVLSCFGLSAGLTVLYGDAPDWGLFEFVALCCVPFGILAIIQFIRAPALRERWIAITPDGVVEYRGPRKGIHLGAAYKNIARIKLGNTRWGPFLIIDYLLFPGSPPPFTWRIEQEYGVSSQIAQAIIESHAIYVAIHARKSSEG